MAWPSNYAQVLVKGSWFDAFNQPIKGFVTFEPTMEIYDTFGQKIIPPAISGIKLVDGGFQVYLLATDEPNVTPKGWKYKVTVSISGGGVFLLDVSKDAGLIDISDWRAAQSTTPDQPVWEGYATLPALESRIPKAEKHAPGGVAELDSSGHLLVDQFPPGEFVPSSLLGQPNGVAQLDANGSVVASQIHAPLVHTQMTPSSTWTINYDYGVTPEVDVYDNNGDVVMADVNYPDNTTVTVSFAFPETGKAILRW